MIKSELIPIVGAVRRNRLRRVTDKDKIDGWHKTSYTTNGISAQPIVNISIWIDQFTKGRFYLSPLTVAFEDEKEFVIFKLWYKG